MDAWMLDVLNDLIKGDVLNDLIKEAVLIDLIKGVDVLNDLIKGDGCLEWLWRRLLD